MPVYLELNEGRSSIDYPSADQGEHGPVLGPFLCVRIWRDDVRLTTETREYTLLRAGDWVIYDSKYWGEVQILPAEQIGDRRKRRRAHFNPALLKQ